MPTFSSTTASVYFDSCLVSAVVKDDHPPQAPALSALLRSHERGEIVAVASTEVLGEIRGLPEEYQGPHLDVWRQLRRLPAAKFSWVDETSTSTEAIEDPDFVKLRGILPDDMDRRHMFHAIKNGVGYFATVDHRTILSRAAQIECTFSIKCGTPAQIASLLGISPSTSTG